MEVTDDGEVMYSFPLNWKRILLQRSLARQFKEKFDKASPLLWAAFRSTFGIALIASLVLIATAIIFAESSSSSSSDNNKSGSSSSSTGGQRLIIDLADVVFNLSLTFRHLVAFVNCLMY